MPSVERYVQFLKSAGEGAPSVEEKVQLLQQMRRGTGDMGLEIDRALLEELVQGEKALREVAENQQKLKEMLEKLTQTPWFPAIFLGLVDTPQGPQALVLHGSSQRIIGFAPEVEPASLATGDQVFLSSELNVIMAKAPQGQLRKCGETARVVEPLPDGRLSVEWRDERMLMEVAGSLDLEEEEVGPGDLVRADRNAWLAFELVEKSGGNRYLVDEVPQVTRDQVGGQDKNLDLLISFLTATLINPDLAAAYGISGKKSILMVGPPGCGKTTMAKVAAYELSQQSDQRVRFAVVRPAEWLSPYVGVTERNIRDCFQSIRSEEGLTVVFMDEIEAVSRTRGSSFSHHADRFLNVLLSEIDGFKDRSQVAIVCATNRKDLIDPAFLERISQVEVYVNRPNLTAAEAIFGIHLPEGLLYATDGKTAEETRADIIDTAVSLFYSPNGPNELCTLRFRDNTVRTVTARELASGRLFEQICQRAKHSAFERDVRTGERGIGVSDITEAVEYAINGLATRLSVSNVHDYLTDIPADQTVVRIDPVRRRVRQPSRYLNVA